VLRRGFRLALEAGKVLATPKIQTPNPHNVRQGFFEVEQYHAVLPHLPEHLRPVVQAAYLTGWRARSELLTRQWRHVDLNGWLRLEPGESKNGEGRNFPLTRELHVLFEAQRERVRELERAQGRIIPWVFPGPGGSRITGFNWYWNRACRLTGVKGRLIHDLRRTAVRDFERCGVPRSAAMKLTGHKTEAVHARYAIVDSAVLQEAAAKLAAFHDAASAAPATKKIVPLVGESN
jgi:integrase